MYWSASFTTIFISSVCQSIVYSVVINTCAWIDSVWKIYVISFAYPNVDICICIFSTWTMAALRNFLFLTHACHREERKSQTAQIYIYIYMFCYGVNSTSTEKSSWVWILPRLNIVFVNNWVDVTAAALGMQPNAWLLLYKNDCTYRSLMFVSAWTVT